MKFFIHRFTTHSSTSPKKKNSTPSFIRFPHKWVTFQSMYYFYIWKNGLFSAHCNGVTCPPWNPYYGPLLAVKCIGPIPPRLLPKCFAPICSNGLNVSAWASNEVQCIGNILCGNCQGMSPGGLKNQRTWTATWFVQRCGQNEREVRTRDRRGWLQEYTSASLGQRSYLAEMLASPAF